MNELAELYEAMNEDEREVLLECARGLMGVGRRSYGPLDLSRPRDTEQDLWEEHRDAVVYSAMIAAKRRRARRAEAQFRLQGVG